MHVKYHQPVFRPISPQSGLRPFHIVQRRLAFRREIQQSPNIAPLVALGPQVICYALEHRRETLIRVRDFAGVPW